jgi:UDPglucose 6-dehydrogenase
MKLAIVGTGYVGLVVGTCFAESGHDVTCMDVDAEKIDVLRRGEVPIYEPGLEELLHRNVGAKRLQFTTQMAEAVGDAQVVFIAVGTPSRDTGTADLNAVLDTAQQVGRCLRQYTVVVSKSTVPVGTSERLRRLIAEVTQVDFDVVSNPEFLKEGAALDDFLKPDRVIIGTRSTRARALLTSLYAPFVRTHNPIIFMDPESAELSKYAANAMLATRISFMNDIAALAEKVGADIELIREGLGSDSRIGQAFLYPGIGYGGSCFPKDVKALVATAREHGLELDLLRAVEDINARQKRLLLTKALRHYGQLSGRTFAVWGLAFKPRTDDVREAPAIELIEGLLGKGARVQCYDPVAAPVARKILGERVKYADVPYDAAQGAEGLFIATEWNEFRRPDLAKLKKRMATPVLFDGRNVIDPVQARAEGFAYYGIGRGPEQR